MFRDAIPADLPTIVAMLAEEQIGGRADDASEPLDPAYLAAFDAIDRDPNQRLIVAELEGAIVGTMQLSWLPGLLNRGAWRGQIEAVRIARDKRSLGLGAAMIGWAVERFRELLPSDLQSAHSAVQFCPQGAHVRVALSAQRVHLTAHPVMESGHRGLVLSRLPLPRGLPLGFPL